MSNMLELLHNNYMRSRGSGIDWKLDIDPSNTAPLSFYQETVKACEIIWANREGPVYVLYSGGLDSEYTLSVFRSLGIDVTPVIIKFVDDLNLPDYNSAMTYCREHNITPQVIDFDFVKFVESGDLNSLAKKYNCGRPEIPATISVAKLLDGTVLCSDDPAHLMKIDDKWYLNEHQYAHAQFLAYEMEGIKGTPMFLKYTINQMLSYMLDPITEEVCNNRIPGKLGTHSTKVHVYNRGAPFSLQNRVKLSGYEFLATHPISNHPDLHSLGSNNETTNLGVAYYEYQEFISYATKLSK